MPFLEDLPSVPSSRFSRKDIELFDKYREEYRKSVNTLKYILARTQTTVNVDLLKEETRFYGSKSRQYLEYLIGKNLDSNSWFCWCWNANDASGEIISSSIAISPPIEEEKFFWYKSMDTIHTIEYSEEYAGYFFPEYCMITAFYIPENLEWLKLFCSSSQETLACTNNTLIGYYRKNYKPFQEGFNLSLESILERSKDYSFLEENISLEHSLENSKKGLVFSSNPGKELIGENGEKYKRVVLIHPGIIQFNCGNERWHIRTSEKSTIHCETIKQNPSLYKRISLDLFSCNLCFCDLGPDEFEEPYSRGYVLIKAENGKVKILNG